MSGILGSVCKGGADLTTTSASSCDTTYDKDYFEQQTVFLVVYILVDV